MAYMSPKYDKALAIMKSHVKDVSAAGELLNEALHEGDARAAYALGSWYLHGFHMQEDLSLGIKLLTRAAQDDVGDALFELAVVYERGHGIKKNARKAFTLYKRAAELGDAGAMEEVGRMLYYGIGTLKDRSAADQWLQRAESKSADASASKSAAQ